MGKQLIYLANHRLPTEKAYGIQIAKMGEALAESGVDLTLIFPARKNLIKENFFDYYGIKNNFKIKKLAAPDFYLPGGLDRIAFLIKNFISALILFVSALFGKTDIIYSRDELPLYFLSFFKKNIVFEGHKFNQSKRFFYKRFRNRGIKLITISSALKDVFIRFGFGPENILVASDGVDLEKFNIKENQKECREKIGLPRDKEIIGYVGQLKTMGMEKGINDLLKSFGILKKQFANLILVIVGGREGDIDFYKDFLKKENLDEGEIIFTGHRPYKEIPFYLKSIDILAMPFPYTKHYAFYMSPLKLFEYMASGRPIVATNLPTVKEILNENNSILVEPGASVSLAEAIKKLLDSPGLGQKISDNALEDVKNYTWQKRVEKILRFLK